MCLFDLQLVELREHIVQVRVVVVLVVARRGRLHEDEEIRRKLCALGDRERRLQLGGHAQEVDERRLVRDESLLVDGVDVRRENVHSLDCEACLLDTERPAQAEPAGADHGDFFLELRQRHGVKISD